MNTRIQLIFRTMELAFLFVSNIKSDNTMKSRTDIQLALNAFHLKFEIYEECVIITGISESLISLSLIAPIPPTKRIGKIEVHFKFP